MEKQEKLKCQICGLESLCLTSHIRIHNITCKEYKLKYKVPSLHLYTKEQQERKKTRTKKEYEEGKRFSVYSLQYWLNKGYSEEEATREIRKRRIFNIEYWLNKGYSEEEAKKELYKLRVKKTTLVSFVEIYGKETGELLWKDRLAKVRKKNKVHVEYWLNKGYSEEEAKIEISKHQTRNLNWFVKKYGKDEGEKRHKEKTQKWLKTLSKKSLLEKQEINKKRGTNKKNKYRKRSEERQSLILKVIALETLEEAITFFINNEVLERQVFCILYSSTVREKFQIKHPYEAWIQYYEKRGIKRGRLGYFTPYKGKMYFSLGEKELAQFLSEQEIEFVYNRPYPGQNKKYSRCLRYDFYVKNINLYIEITGLKDQDYRKRLEKKKQLCLSQGLNVLFSEDIDFLKQEISRLYEDKKNKN